MRVSRRLTSGLAPVEDLPLTGFSGGRDGMNELNHGQPESASVEQNRLRASSMLSVMLPPETDRALGCRRFSPGPERWRKRNIERGTAPPRSLKVLLIPDGTGAAGGRRLYRDPKFPWLRTNQSANGCEAAFHWRKRECVPLRGPHTDM